MGLLGYTSNNNAGDKQRILDLEAQLKEMSYTAATAIDRVSELEQQLVQAQSPKGMTRSASTSSEESFEYHFDGREKLRKLQQAVETIHHARKELREPAYYQYM